MDAGFVDDLVVISRPNLPVFPVFFPVIRKFKFGDWFESDCILSQPIYLIAMEFFTSRFSERFRSETAFRCPLHVRSYPNSGQTRARSVCPLSAKSGLMHRSKWHLYSITSSAMESTPAGMVRPSALAVVRLMTNSNLVDCSTGRSAGFAPLR